MRRKIVAGNWKMNTSPAEGVVLTNELIKQAEQLSDCILIVAPPFLHITQMADLLGNTNIALAAQNCHQELSGAYTGEISPAMLKASGVKYVILGHSERRTFFGENNTDLAKKVNAVLEQGMEVIYCCGETLDERKGDVQEKVVATQITEALYHLSQEEWDRVVIAYEPVWAIGTGETASAAQAQEMHAFIRNHIAEEYGQEMAAKVSILYGGSCKPGNAKELFAQADVDGGLIGGAALKANDFIAIANSY